MFWYHGRFAIVLVHARLPPCNQENRFAGRRGDTYQKRILTIYNSFRRLDFLLDVRARISVLHVSRYVCKLLPNVVSLGQLSTVFSWTPTVKHDVQLNTTGSLIFLKVHSLPPQEFSVALREFKLLKQGICRPSDSCWSSPFHLVPKPNGEWRRLQALEYSDNFIAVLHFYHPRLYSWQSVMFSWPWISRKHTKKTVIFTSFKLFEFTRMVFACAMQCKS